jgi:acyl dehydratase
MIDSDKTRAWQSGDIRHSYGPKDTILYHLGLGIGSDPMDERQQRFAYEKDLVVLPTIAAVLASPGAWMRERSELGIDFLKLVHGEQAVTLHAPMHPAATVIGRSRVTRLVDKGEGKGAVLHAEKSLTDEASGLLLATTEQVLFLRGDGGFAARGGVSDGAAPPPPPMPERSPDRVLDLPTRPDTALLYRLSGDLNPLHVDPAFAARAGFARPILHGLATWAMAGWGLVQGFGDGDPARLKSLRARLSAPVYPGETLRLACWQGDGEIAFSCRVVERDVVVLSHGRALL